MFLFAALCMLLITVGLFGGLGLATYKLRNDIFPNSQPQRRLAQALVLSVYLGALGFCLSIVLTMGVDILR